MTSIRPQLSATEVEVSLVPPSVRPKLGYRLPPPPPLSVPDQLPALLISWAAVWMMATSKSQVLLRRWEACPYQRNAFHKTIASARNIVGAGGAAAMTFETSQNTWFACRATAVMSQVNHL